MTVLFELKNISKEYGYNKILDNINIKVNYGDRIGLVGNNGSGKTTLANIIYGTESYKGGIVWNKGNVAIGYMKQSVEYIQGFDTLSGGEKTKKLLSDILYGNYELIILDEPTNHIDFHVREQLEEALIGFNGTIILVTHDRYMLEKVCNKLLVFKNNKIIRYEYGIKEYLDRQKAKNEEDAVLVLENRKSFILSKLSQCVIGSEEYNKWDFEFRELIKKIKKL